MGIPYSKQINSAFDQVTPLVACGFRVLETTRDISILVALIQVFNFVLLGLILLSMVGLLITVNPDLAAEREVVVTPVMRWLASWISNAEDRKWLQLVVFVIFGGVGLGAWTGCYVMRDTESLTRGQPPAELVEEVIESSGM